ncbi:MAG: flagellar basal body-associated protein FliL [Pseudorhodobacter sp.]
MAEAETPVDQTPKKALKPAVLLGFLAALLLGGGGFYVTWSGLLGSGAAGVGAVAASRGPLPDLAFVPVDPVVISLGPAARARHLRFTAQLEVNRGMQADVTLLMPRILDVVNGYLRAVDVARLEDPAGLVVLRAQMLRRIQLVTGEGRVRDLLITEFVLN